MVDLRARLEVEEVVQGRRLPIYRRKKKKKEKGAALTINWITARTVNAQINWIRARTRKEQRPAVTGANCSIDERLPIMSLAAGPGSGQRRL